MAQKGNTNVASPFEVLAALDKRCKARALSLPIKQVAEDQWVGTGFRIHDYYCVAPVGEINELMLVTAMSRVPRAKPWVMGISNVRGSLLPIIDLGGFLFNRLSAVRRDSRILVIRNNGMDVGLLVDEVLGMQHFQTTPSPINTVDADPPFPDMTTGVFNNDGAVWWVVDVLALCENSDFLSVSA